MNPNRSIARFLESFGGWSVMCVGYGFSVDPSCIGDCCEGRSTSSHGSVGCSAMFCCMGGRSLRYTWKSEVREGIFEVEESILISISSEVLDVDSVTVDGLRSGRRRKFMCLRCMPTFLHEYGRWLSLVSHLITTATKTCDFRGTERYSPPSYS